MDPGLTSWAASEDQLTDFIIDKDEQGVGEGAEPPVGPEKHTHEEMRSSALGQDEQHVVGGVSKITESDTCVYSLLVDGEMSFCAYLRGYILRAMSMPGQ